MKIKGSNVGLLGVVVGLAVVGFLGGTAVARVPTLSAPENVLPTGGVESTPAPMPVYSKNELGQTYGSAISASSPETEPDLILVIATNGSEGYVSKADLDVANGTAAASNFKSPADALEWQKSKAGQSVSIPVYQSNGKTVIGSFTVTSDSTPQH